MNIATLNCRGLGKYLTRNMIFRSLENFSIICLQETYITDANCQLWSQDWSGGFFYECGSMHSNGLITLVNKSFNVDNLSQIKINDRCLGITFVHLDKHFYIFNLYAPADKDERIPFFIDLPSLLQLDKIPSDSLVILAGDFNTYSNEYLDNIRGAPHNPHEVEIFNDFLDSCQLTDCWRYKNLFVKDFSWIRHVFNTGDSNRSPYFSARRLDFILCNNNLLTYLKSAKMSHFSSTDHKLVSSFFLIDAFPRGPGRWQLNESLLDDDFFILHMNDFISAHKIELYNQNFLDKRILWDLLKMGIRDETIAYARMKSLEKLENDSKFDKEINILNEKLILDPNNQTIAKSLYDLTVKKELVQLAECRGALKRSKLQNIELGERNTKFFLNIEKNRQSHGVIRSVYDNNEELVFTPEKKLCEVSNFYKNLLNPEMDDKNDSVCPISFDSFIDSTIHPTLNSVQKDDLESFLDIDELKVALTILNRESSPGLDGLSPLFYIIFWELLKDPLFDCYKESIANKSLSLSQRRAIISLLPKGTDIDLNSLSNWRPISLLCTDYKILSRALATRLEKVLSKLIHPNQVGYIRGRSISDHTRLTDDVINYCNKENIPGILVSLDYRKAFDTISKASIIAALRQFNFGPVFIGYIQTLINDTQTCVKNGGWLSSFFDTKRGVRQGCIISPLLFIMVVEILAIKIRADNQIESILDHTPNFQLVKLKCLLYADDISLYLKNPRSVLRSLFLIDKFHFLTGLGLNRKKCLCLGLGNIDLENQYIGGLTLLDKNQNIKLLGIFYNAEIEASLIQENHVMKLQDIKDVVRNWTRRNITLLGKCLVTKMFMISKINNIIQPLALPTAILDTIDQLMFKFLWNSSTGTSKIIEKIKRTTLCLPTEEGGIDMISARDQQSVMLIKWLKRPALLENDVHLDLVNVLCRNVGGINYVSECNADVKYFRGIENVQSYFWQRVIRAWASLDKSNFSCSPNLMNMPIFNNSLIVYKSRPLYIKKWVTKGPKYVKELFTGDNFKSLDEVRHDVGNYGGLFFDYSAAKTAVINHIKHSKDTPCDKQSFSFIPKYNNKMLRIIIVRQKQGNSDLNCAIAWKRRLGIDIKPYFTVAKKATKETKLRWLHYKIVQNIFPTNLLLKKMNIKQSDACDHCGLTDTIVHYFFGCSNLSKLWSSVEDLLEGILKEEITLDPINAILGFERNYNSYNNKKIAESNRLLLVTKHTILKYHLTSKYNIMYMLYKEIELRKDQFPSIVLQ